MLGAPEGRAWEDPWVSLTAVNGRVGVLAVPWNTSSGSEGAGRKALARGAGLGGSPVDRAVSTVEDIEQAAEERKLIATSQGFLETSGFSSYREAGRFLLHVGPPLLRRSSSPRSHSTALPSWGRAGPALRWLSGAMAPVPSAL